MESLRAAIEGVLSGLQTAMPGIVTAVNLTKNVCSVQPSIQFYVRQPDGSQLWVTPPQLINVPIVFPSAGGFALTFPIAEGDEVLVICASRCIDAWWQNGGVQVQAEFRMHDWGDGFAIPGPRSLPNALENISGSAAQLRSLDGSTYIEIAAGGVVNIKAPGGVNINGAVIATGEVTANGGHTVSAHVHGGVQTGGGTTAGPTG